MMVLLWCFLLLGLSFAASSDLPNGGKRWAILVASSKGFNNYRHQADICHAYQLLHANGIPDENIIVMMYDDIAYSPYNPLPGVVRNSIGGPDLYQGVPKDYTGQDVTKDNFLRILSGDSAAMEGVGSGRVLQSGPDDHVFVNVVDHGAPFVLSFPGTNLFGDELVATLHSMADQRKFGKLVVYIEACEAGSLFQNILQPNRSIYVTTASNAYEPSYSCCYDEEVKMLVGDVYSVNWLHLSEQVNLSAETIFFQYQKVRNLTKDSHVTEYGDRSLRDDVLAGFFGTSSRGASSTNSPSILQDVVSSRDVQTEVLRRKLRAPGLRRGLDVLQEIGSISQGRRSLKHVVSQIAAHASSRGTSRLMVKKRSSVSQSSVSCYKDLVQHFQRHCKGIGQDDDVLSYYYVLLNICDEKLHDTAKLKDVIETICEKERGSSPYKRNVSGL